MIAIASAVIAPCMIAVIAVAKRCDSALFFFTRLVMFLPGTKTTLDPSVKIFKKKSDFLDGKTIRANRKNSRQITSKMKNSGNIKGHNMSYPQTSID